MAGTVYEHVLTTESLAVALTRAESALVFGGYAGLALLMRTVLPYRRDADRARSTDQHVPNRAGAAT